ncbi:hypothetical protein GJ744_007918 [Endocarpon pusillum]|uniref:Uncharacterized protein n=1 Tax=Endocarpon pusillum TaxID=364733 RepID=A0A8H7E614_9EURO|nr:hypothetical protein GJ744_007918 [Endocarpon pusillum]
MQEDGLILNQKVVRRAMTNESDDETTETTDETAWATWNRLWIDDSAWGMYRRGCCCHVHQHPWNIPPDEGALPESEGMKR